MRRLYLQIYLAFVGASLLFALAASGLWVLTAPYTHERRMYEGAAAVAQDLLPPAGASREALRGAVDRLATQLLSDITVRDRDGSLLAAAGVPLDPPRRGRRRGWSRAGARGWTFALPLPDGRWLLARHRALYGGWEWMAGVLVFAAAIAIGAYPVARRIARRLERLRRQVDELAAGSLSSRVSVEGHDEVAALARSFNRAAEQIERLVGAQRSILAAASHELRTPLARLRMAFELLAGDERPDLQARVEHDIRELDGLIDELLLASRLDTIDGLDSVESVDLLGLAAEEAARYRADVSGTAVEIDGDPRLLRRMVRNLLENAARHGQGTPIEVTLSGAGAVARLCVLDRGPGVAPGERERIFEPFYRPAGTREDGAGVGLGLALVRQIARRHGGDVRCLPRDGGGTCFEVELGRRSEPRS